MTATSVPPSELYFAVLAPPVSPRGRARAEELAYAFEAALPLPLSAVHAVYHTLPDQRVLAIAIERAHAERLARAHTRAHPQAWPGWLAPLAGAIRPHACNLLTGPCLPPRVSAARRSIVRHACVGAAVILTAASLGFERRIRHLAADTAAARARAAETAAAVLSGGAPSHQNAGSLQPAFARMTSELRRLRATRGPAPRSPAQLPADAVLARVLAAWPTDARARTESITVAERTVEVVLRLDDLGSAQSFVSALAAVPGLRPGPARTDQEADEVRLSLRLDREDAP